MVLNKNIKDPALKFRYSRGVGDVIASILHGKLFGWLVHLITGRNTPCQMCSRRADALNILFPIPVWRLFFKTPEELTKKLDEEYKKNGYETKISDDKKGISANLKTYSNPIEKTDDKSSNKNRNDINNYTFVSKSTSITGDILIEIKVYKFNNN